MSCVTSSPSMMTQTTISCMLILRENLISHHLLVKGEVHAKQTLISVHMYLVEHAIQMHIPMSVISRGE